MLGNLENDFANLKNLDLTEPEKRIHTVMETSINSIEDKWHRDGYRCIAVFGKKTKIPNQALGDLWRTDYDNAEARVECYLDCSLATRKTVTFRSLADETYTVEFHDRHFEYAKFLCRKEDERKQNSGSDRVLNGDTPRNEHDSFLTGYELLLSKESINVWWDAEILNDGYFYGNYVKHLVYAGRMDELY